MMQQGNCMPIQEALISALQAGLQTPGGDAELAAMGVRSASIAALRSLSPSHLIPILIQKRRNNPRPLHN